MKKLDLKQSIHVTLEPGDCTHYEFLITKYNDKYINICNFGNTPLLKSIILEKNKITGFIDNVGIPPKEKEKYSNWIIEKKVLQQHFINYIYQETKCNLYVILAGIIACFYATCKYPQII